MTVPGYDPRLVRNHLLFPPRKHNVKHFANHLSGLAKLLILDFASRPSVGYALNGLYYLEEKIKREILQELKMVKPSDYGDVAVPHAVYAIVRQVYERFKRQDAFFNRLAERRQLEWKPYYLYALNDVESVIHARENTSHLSDHIEVSMKGIFVNRCMQWVTINPGSQRVGSFCPVTTNFYQDAYCPATVEHPVVVVKKYVDEVVWCYLDDRGATVNFDKDQSQAIEKAYVYFCNMGDDYNVTANDQELIEKINFSEMTYEGKKLKRVDVKKLVQTKTKNAPSLWKTQYY